MSVEEALARAREHLWAAELPAARDEPAPERSGSGHAPAAAPDDAVARIGSALRGRELSCRELVEWTLARADVAARELGCFVELLPDRALAAAEILDAELAAGGDRGPLHGIPIAVKDVIDLEGRPTGLGTAGFGHRLAAVDAAVCGHLARAGAIAIGKTTTHELAWGTVTPGTRNPIAPGRIAGGSSGGSAVAVAAGVVPLALGTDTGGSVRIPAALCGVAGLRPSHGAIDRRGVAPLAPTQDTVGFVGASAALCGLAFDRARGSASIARGPTPPPLQARRLGVLGGRWAERAAGGSAAVAAAAYAGLEEAGFELVPLELALAPLATAASYVVMLAESAYWWAVPGAGGAAPAAAVRELLAVGGTVSAADYLRALEVGRALRDELEGALRRERLQAVLLLTTPVGAPRLGAETVAEAGRPEPVEVALPRLCSLASVTGGPALSVPVGLDSAGLPVGVQVVAARGEERAVCAVGGALEAGAASRQVAELRRLRADAQFAGLAPPSRLIEEPLM